MKTVTRIAVLALAMAMAEGARGRVIELRTDSSSCLVETKGAHILSFRERNEERLWSPWPLQLEGAEWQHGGIPICWPVYGHDPAGLHGFAWKSEFAVVSKTEGGSVAELVLALENGGHRLDYTIRLGNGLELEFATSNASSRDFVFSEAFHPYFLVGDRDRCTVAGDIPEALAVNRALDVGYDVVKGAGGAEYRLQDPVGGCTLVITSENSPRVNIWNPGEGLDGGWRRFVCVEPCISRHEPIVLKPGGRHVMKMRFRVEPESASGKAAAKPAGDGRISVSLFPSAYDRIARENGITFREAVKLCRELSMDTSNLYCVVAAMTFWNLRRETPAGGTPSLVGDGKDGMFRG